MPCFIYLWLFCVSYMLLLPTVSGFCSFMLKYSSAHVFHTSRQFECLTCSSVNRSGWIRCRRGGQILIEWGHIVSVTSCCGSTILMTVCMGFPFGQRIEVIHWAWSDTVTLSAFILRCVPVCSFLICVSNTVIICPACYTCWCCRLYTQTTE